MFKRSKNDQSEQEQIKIELTGYEVIDHLIEKSVQLFGKHKEGLEKIEVLLHMFNGIAEREINNQTSMDEFVAGIELSSNISSEKHILEAFRLNYQTQNKQRKKIGQLIQFRICNVLKEFLNEEKEKNASMKIAFTQVFKLMLVITQEIDTLKGKALKGIRKQAKGNKKKELEICKAFNDDRQFANKNISIIFQTRLSLLLEDLKRCEEKRMKLILSAVESFSSIQSEINSSTGAFIEKMQILSSATNAVDLSRFDEFIENQGKALDTKGCIPYDLPVQLEGETKRSLEKSLEIDDNNTVVQNKPVLSKEGSEKQIHSNPDEVALQKELPSKISPKDLPDQFQSHDKKPANLLEESQDKKEIPSESATLSKKEKPVIKPKDFKIEAAGKSATRIINIEENEEISMIEIKPDTKQISNVPQEISPKPQKFAKAVRVMFSVQEAIPK
jgi:hypothetical protein